MQKALHLGDHFTSVVGNEVTTSVGHMNAFPMKAGGALPNHRLKDWVALVADCRDKGARAVVLNHPHYPALRRSPWAQMGFNRASGEFRDGVTFPFDALEVINSGSRSNPPVEILADWLAMLNQGQRVAAVGTSDSHTVGDVVGQGRTYVKSSTDDPKRIDVNEVVDNLAAGRSSISLGIFAELSVGEFSMGDVVTTPEGPTVVTVRVRAPSWVRPREVGLFVNGVRTMRTVVPTEPGRATDATISLSMALPRHDAHLVCIVEGDPVTDASWPTVFPYTIAATNPVFLDVSRGYEGPPDGQYTSPGDVAHLLVRDHVELVPNLGESVDGMRDTFANIYDDLTVPILSATRAWLRRLHADDPATARHLLVRLAGMRSGRPAAVQRYLDGLPPIKEAN